jgi:hypothetical protein
MGDKIACTQSVDQIDDPIDVIKRVSGIALARDNAQILALSSSRIVADPFRDSSAIRAIFLPIFFSSAVSR